MNRIIAMLIKLDGSLKSKSRWSIEEKAVIEQILISAFRGVHLVILGNVNLYEIFASNDFGLSVVSRAALDRIRSQYALRGAAISLVDEYIVVTVDQSISIAAPGISLPLSIAIDINFLPVVVLAENSIDAEIFEIAARHFVTNKRANGLNVNLVARGGGGSQIFPELENSVLKDRRLTLVVTDADFKYPNADHSDTSKKCQRFTEEKGGICRHYIIPVREIENLIPEGVREELLIKSNSDAEQRLRLVCDAIPEVQVFCDLKDGLAAARMFKLSVGPEFDFIMKISKTAGGVDRRCQIQESCHAERQAPEQRCQCILVPKIGALAPGFLSWLKTQSNHKALEAFSGTFKDWWLEIGAIVFSRAVAEPRLRG